MTYQEKLYKILLAIAQARELRKVRMTKTILSGVNDKQYYVRKECQYKKQMIITILLLPTC